MTLQNEKMDPLETDFTQGQVTGKKTAVPHILGSVFSLLAIAGMILGYFLFVNTLDNRITNISKMCTDSDKEVVDVLKHPPSSDFIYWTYNLTNPMEYANGGTAELHELGPYALSLQPKTSNVDLSESEGTLSYAKYNQLEFKAASACDECDEFDVMNIVNPVYLRAVGGAQNEAMMMIAATCTQMQIGLISASGTYDYCTANEMGTAAVCRCCAPTPTASAVTCGTIASPTSKVGGLFSWLAKYDNGLQLNSAASAFPLSTGAYTSLIRRVSVTEIPFGLVSAHLGLLSTSKAIKSGDKDDLYKNSNTTNDLMDACYTLNCPSVIDIVVAMSTQGMSAVIGVDCPGVVASYKVLMSDGGLSEQRAKQLRYMEGTSCKPFGVTVAIAAILTADSKANYTCADGSQSLPCCLSSYQSSTLGNGGGLGCQQWVPGLVQTRRVYSSEEAYEYIMPSPEQKAYSGCADGDKKLQQIMWQGNTEYKDWFTPSSYVYPNMPWADPTIVSSALKGTASGVMTYLNVSGYLPALRRGRGITSKFLEYQLTDGDPIDDHETIWSGYRLNRIEVEFEGARKVNGLDVNRFIPDISKGDTVDDMEMEQRLGQMPAANMENLVYTIDGAPIIMSHPNFYSTEEKMLSQTSNIERGSASQVGVNLYRTRNGYNRKSKLLDEPELITNATWDTFGNSEYRGYLHVEPATGVALEGILVNMVSTFTWNCNPTKDASCAFKTTAFDAGNPMCYSDGSTMMPCGATNVFTPRIMGGKVLPVYWLRVNPEAPEYVSDHLKYGADTRYALSIAVIIVPCLACIALVVCVLFIVKTLHPHVPVSNQDKDKI